MPYWRKHFSTGFIDPKDGKPNVSPNQSSEIVSILSAGTFFGALTASPVGDILGRRLGLIVSTAVFTFGCILQTIAIAIPLFVAGRFFAGFGVGLISALSMFWLPFPCLPRNRLRSTDGRFLGGCPLFPFLSGPPTDATHLHHLVPLYQSETSPKWIRGTIVGSYQLAITIGLLLAAIVNNSSKDRNDTGSYRIPVAVQFAWAIILVVGMIILPETPRYLIKRGKPEDAARALSRLRRLDASHPAIVEELAEVEANHQYELSLGKATYIDCLRGTLGKRLITGCGLQALQQLTGVNFIFYYGTKFFDSSGIKNPFVVSMITSVVNVCSTFPGLYLVEKWGRRPLLLFGAVGMFVCQFVVAIVGVTAHSDAANKSIVAFVCIYIFFFACSWGPVAWVVTGELFPLKVRAKSLSMTTATNWLLNWAIAYSTPYLVDGPGKGYANLGVKVFFIWGGFCFICGVFVWFMIYETKGLSLEQVDELYSKVNFAWR